MSGWAIGWIVGGVVVAVVVVLLALMIAGARRAAEKAEQILDALDEARQHTAALWELDVTNQTAARIVAAATAAREHLEGSHR